MPPILHLHQLFLRAALIAHHGSSPNPSPSPTPTPSPPAGPQNSAFVPSSPKQFTLTSTTTATKPFTIGYVFAAGDFPPGAGVVADNVSNLQVNKMTAWPDGSLKTAILSGSTALTANVAKTVTIKAGTAATGTALTTTDLKNTGITASIGCGSFGTVSWATTDWDTPFVTYATGSQMSSWIYRKPVGSDAHLVGWLEVRLYATGEVDVLPWIENGYIHVASPVNKAASYVFTLGGTARSTQTIDLPCRCRTPLVAGTALSYWLGTDPALTIIHNKAYLQSTEVIPTYMATVDPASSLVAAMPTTFTPLQQGGFTYSSDLMESSAFEQPIGLLPHHDVLYLTSAASSLYAAVQRNGYSAGRYPLHYRDESTNRPLLFASHPYLSTDSSTTGDYPALPTGTVPPDWDVAHHPSVGFLAYLLTGRFYHMETVQFAATRNYIDLADNIRNYGVGLIEPLSGAVQTRQFAWYMRTLITAIIATPDGDALGLQAQFIAAWVAVINQNHTRYLEQSNNPLGFIANNLDYTITFDSGSDRLAAATAAGYMAAGWMHDFIVAVFGWAIAAGMPIGSTAQTKLLDFFANFIAKSVVGRLSATNAGTDYLFTECAPYLICVSPSHTPDWIGGTGPWFSNWNQVYQATKSVAATFATSAQFKDDPTTINEISMPPAEGYVVNMLPALAYCVRHNVPGAAAGLTRLQGAIDWSVAISGFDPTWTIVDSLNQISPVWGVKSAGPILPNWVLAANVNQWVTIPGSVQAGSTVDLDGGLSTNSRLSFSGFTVRDTEIWLTATGGHADYNGNEVCAIDIGLNSPAWQLRHARSTTILADVYYEPDGTPASAHRYWGGFWSKETGRIMQPSTRSTWPNATASGSQTNGFNPSNNTWDAAGTWTDVPTCNVMDGDGNCWSLGQNFFDIVKFVPSTNTVSTLYSSGGVDIQASPAAFDSKRKNIFAFSCGNGEGNHLSEVRSYIVNQITGQPTNITFNTSAAFTQWFARVPLYQGMDYDPVNDQFLVFCPLSNYDSYAGGDTTVYVIKPNNTTVWDMSILSVTGTLPTPTVSAQTRFKYVPQLGGFACMPSGLGSMYFLRTSAALVVSSPPPSPAPSPSPTPAPSPAPTPSPTPAPSPSPTPSPSPAPAPSPITGAVFLAPLQTSTPTDTISSATMTALGNAAFQSASPGPAWSFGGNSGNALRLESFTGFTGVGGAFTLGVFWRQNSATNIGSGIFLIGLNGDSDNKLLELELDSSYNIRAYAYDAVHSNLATSYIGDTNTAYDNWQLAAIVRDSNSSLKVYVNGLGFSTPDTTTVDLSASAYKIIMASQPNSGLGLSVAGFEKYGFAYPFALTQSQLDSIFASPGTVLSA